MEWERTDDLQFVKQIDEDNFIVIETTLIADDRYIIQEVAVDMEDYNDQDLNEIVRSYYDSLAEIKETYGAAWKKIVAEIIAEQEGFDSGGPRFESEEEVYTHLKTKYGIEVN